MTVLPTYGRKYFFSVLCLQTTFSILNNWWTHKLRSLFKDYSKCAYIYACLKLSGLFFHDELQISKIKSGIQSAIGRLEIRRLRSNSAFGHRLYMLMEGEFR